jgi:hypothetical protein
MAEVPDHLNRGEHLTAVLGANRKHRRVLHQSVAECYTLKRGFRGSCD